MKDPENTKMHLNIGDQRITLTVPFDRQEFVRETEAGVDGLYAKWRKSFPAKTDKEILAMVAYQYAAFYGELKERQNMAMAIADQCIAAIAPPDSSKEETDPDFE